MRAILCVCLFVTQFRQSIYTYLLYTHFNFFCTCTCTSLTSTFCLSVHLSVINFCRSFFCFFILNTLCGCCNFRAWVVLTQYMVGFIVIRIWCQLLLYLCIWLCQIVAVFSFIHNRAGILQVGIGSKISCFSFIAWNKRIGSYIEFQFLEFSLRMTRFNNK